VAEADQSDPGAGGDAPLDDAAEALREQDDAQTFELPDRSGASVPDLLPGMGFGSTERRARTPEGSPRRGEAPQSLEDLWVAYPKVGSGDWKYRVERVHPKTYAGVQVAGILGDFFERMSMEEFRHKFGGNTYEITVMQPVGEGGPDGAAGYRRVRTIKLRLPGAPTMAGVEEDEDMRGHQFHHGGYMSAGDNPQIRTKELELDHQRRRDEREDRQRLEGELRDTLREQSRAPEGALETVSSSQRMAFDEVKRTNQSALLMWQEQAEMLRADVKAKDSEINQIRRDLAEAQVNATNTARHIETEAMRQQKDRYDEDVRRVRDENADRMARMQEDHRKELADISNRQTEERRNYESQQSMDRERVRDDAKMRVESAQDMSKREVENMRRDYDARVHDMKSQQERELSNLKERFESEVRAVQSSEKAQASFSKEAAEMKVAISGDQAARYESEAATLRQQVEELRAQIHKPPMEAFMEAKEMAGALGMVDASEARGEAEQQTTAQQLFGLAKGVVDNLPSIVERVTDARGRNQSDVARQQHEIAMMQRHQQQQGAGRPMPGQHRLALPPGIQPMQRNVPGIGSMPPPMMLSPEPSVPMQSGSLDMLHPSGSFPIQSGPPGNVPSPIQPGMAPTDTAPMPMGAGPAGVPMGGAPAAGDVPPMAMPVPTSFAQPVAQPSPPIPAQAEPILEQPLPHGPMALATLPPEAVQEFYSNLEMAVQTKTVPPLSFAQQFVERVGADRTAQLVREVSPGDIIDIVREAGGDSSAMATRDGYRYVEELWMHARMITDEMRQEGAPAPQPPQGLEQMIPPPAVDPPVEFGTTAMMPEGHQPSMPEQVPMVVGEPNDPPPDANDAQT
jgi:hypothetical protein